MLARWLPGALLLVLSLAGCAAPGSDVHLAPVWSRTHAADGKRDVELAAGLYRHRSDDGFLEELTLGPLYSLDRERNGDWRARFLVPLGLAHAKGEERRYWLLPLASFEKRYTGEGEDTNWSFLSLVGLIGRGGDSRPSRFGWFPFFVRFDDFLIWDELTAFLFPLYVRSKVKERVSNHFLFPIFSVTHGPNDSGFRIWPLYGRATKEGRYDRRFLLWPFLHQQRNFLGGGGEEPETMFMFWPFYGNSQRGTFQATTVLWPLFGYSQDSRSDFWAFDAFWIFVRLQRGPGELERTRFWPVYGFLSIPGLRYTTFLWPLGHYYVEDNDDFEKSTVWFFPLWQSQNQTDKDTGELYRWRKLWPLLQFEADGERQVGSFPAVDPFPPNQLFDRHYAWATKLWEWENGGGGTRRERSWGGLWRRERTPVEDRRSLAGLWSRRTVTLPDGRRTKETSLLFGLLRWRSDSEDGFGLMRPAFPGPGWPALEGVPERAPEPPPRPTTLQAPAEPVEEDLR